ncbi:MAG: prephenate dehydrogenase/arogenate dehydrogenase family protein [Bacteroidales bacterium]|nr:prephenate dehydrogenase/arogenate dehydrogenase family protein [Bacteroidales bacterium]
MKILILGAGNMGSFFVESLCLEHDVAVFDTDKTRLRYLFHTRRFVNYEQIEAFQPEMLINCVSLQHTLRAFEDVLPWIPETCMISDITSVKTGLPEYYKKTGRPFVSTHPMFGPTFANLKELSSQSAVIISESDEKGKSFFRDFYGALKLQLHEYTFDQHDQTTAYSLSIPFTSSLVFAACMKPQEAPGTTFKKHMETAKGLMSEDNYLLSEILLNPYTLPQLENIEQALVNLKNMIKEKDQKGLHAYFQQIRHNLRETC